MMKVFLVYLFLEYKRTLKVFSKSIASLILILCLTCAGVVAAAHVMSEAKVFKSIDVAVVIPEDASEIKLITQFISSMDSVKAICNFDYMTQEEAIGELYSGNIQAVISLPETLYEDIYMGRSAVASVYFPEQTSLNIQVFQELLRAGLSLVSTTEAGVFASTDTAQIDKAQMDQYEIANYISYEYIGCAFDRNEIFNNTVYSPYGDVDLYQYYLAAGFSVILLMFGMNFGYLFERQNKIVEQKLNIMGLTGPVMALIKVIIMTTVLWAVGAVSYAGILCIGKWTKMVKLWFDWKVFLWILLLAAAVAVYFLLLYSLAGKGFSGSVFVLCANIGMIICSGAIVPTAYLPKTIGRIGAWMPMNFMNRFCASMIFDSAAVNDILVLLIWIAVVFVSGIGVRKIWNGLPGIRFGSKHG